MLIKSMKYEIIKPTNSTWEELGKILSELRYKSARIANYTVQLLWQWDNYKYEYKQKDGEYPPITEKPYLYKIIREKYPDVGCDIINQTSRWVENKYSSIKKDMFMLRKSVLSFKDNMPIFLNNQSYKVNREGNDYIFDVRLQTKLSDCNVRYSFIVKVGEHSKRLVLDKLISGQYKKSMLQIIPDSKHKWYIILAYGFEPEIQGEYINERVLDVILGDTVEKAISLKVRKTTIDKVIPVNDVLHAMRKFNARLKDLKEQRYYMSTNRTGHGRKKLIAPVQSIQDKISNFKNTANHKFSSIIVSEAKRHKCSRIKVSGESFFMEWPISDLSYKIKYKAEQLGIRFSDTLDVE